MNERQLRYACGVWRERSFSRAAERLHVSQPSLSDQVRLLEEEIGFAIFYRGARGVESSVNGQVFLERAQQVLDSLAKLDVLGRQLQGRDQTHIRIGFNTGIAAPLLTDAAGVIAAQTVKFQLEVATSTNRRILRLISQDKLDAGFLLNADMDAWANKLQTIAFVESPIVVVLPREHPLILQDEPLDLARIAAFPLVVSETELGAGRAIIALFKKAGAEPDIVADCDNVESAKAMVVSGLGIALLPRICVEQDILEKRVFARSLCEPVNIPVQFVRGLRTQSPALETCLSEIGQAFVRGLRKKTEVGPKMTS